MAQLVVCQETVDQLSEQFSGSRRNLTWRHWSPVDGGKLAGLRIAVHYLATNTVEIFQQPKLCQCEVNRSAQLCSERTRRRCESKSLSRPFVELAGDRIQVRLRVA